MSTINNGSSTDPDLTKYQIYIKYQ